MKNRHGPAFFRVLRYFAILTPKIIGRSCIIRAMDQPRVAPSLSVVIPVFNEVALLESVLQRLRQELPAVAGSYEIILSENGSTDGSRQMADALAAGCPQIRVIHAPLADYGLALKRGLEAARGRYVFHCAVDLADLRFLQAALERIETHDAVLGSKYIEPGTDTRPWFRRAAGRMYAGMLRTLFRLPVADTHGIKLFRRNAIAPHIAACRFGGAMFDTELILGISRAGLRLIEIPIASSEVRPSRKNNLAMAFQSLVDLSRLAAARIHLRLQQRPGTAKRS
jgi:glycosyltransferase involved in cell wall biosynthesis